MELKIHSFRDLTFLGSTELAPSELVAFHLICSPILQQGTFLIDGEHAYAAMKERYFFRTDEYPATISLIDPTTVEPTGWSYNIEVRFAGGYRAQLVLDPVQTPGTIVDGIRTINITDILPLDFDPEGTPIVSVRGLPGDSPEIPNFTASAFTVPSGGEPSATIAGEYPNLEIQYGLVEGPQGPPLNQPNFSASAFSVPYGSSPSAIITGSYPDLEIQYGLVTGPPGTDGVPGAVPTSSSYLIVGPGRPDVPASTGGLITGSEPVGCEYRSTDGSGVGAWVWRKRPSGWAVVDGDTGWRNVLTALGAIPEVSIILIRRELSIVRIFIVTGPATASSTILTANSLPVGWRPYGAPHNHGHPYGKMARNLIATPVNVAIGMTAWDYQIYTNPIAGGYSRAEFAFGCYDAWPTTLPGTSA